MFGPRPEKIAEDKRAILREVALTYRRVDRALKAEGATPPEHHAAAYEAAMAAYLRLDPDAPKDRLEASGIVSTMIANAIAPIPSGSGSGPTPNWIASGNRPYRKQKRLVGCRFGGT